MIKQKTQLFFAFFSILVVVASLFSFYRFTIQQDFLVFTTEESIPVDMGTTLEKIMSNTLVDTPGVFVWNK